MSAAIKSAEKLKQDLEAIRTGREATALAFELADSVAVSDIEICCKEVGRRDKKGWWYDTSQVEEDDLSDFNKALLYLGLRGLLLRNENNPYIVSIARE